jgi:signal transduction histidine kinase
VVDFSIVATSSLHLVGIVLLAALYALVAKASLSLDAIQGFATLVWPPTGIALAATIRFGFGVWPGIAVGAFAANVWQGAPPAAALGIAVGNTMEAVLGAYLLRRVGFRSSFDRLSDVAAFLGLGALCAPLVSATLGPLSLSAAKAIPIDHVAETWLAWWIGDACGALIVGSLLLAWSSPSPFVRLRGRALEASMLSILFALAAVVPMIGPVGSRSVAFLVFPLLIWATVRFGQRGATSATALVCTAAVVFTAMGYGPFMSGRLQERLFTMQAYMIVMVVTLLVLGAVTEERARAVEALHRALDAREEFLSIASHELKTPLSAMVLNLTGLQRLLRLGDPLSTDTVSHKVDRVVRQTGRLTALINQLLDVSRISSHTLELVREELDLCELARDVCGRFSEESARSGSAISLTGTHSLRGQWDRLRLEQVLSNLLSNAIRYGDGRPIEVSLEERGRNAVIVVRDHGRGIAPEELPWIFDRFSSSKAARRVGGLGLGLYISRQIVKGHGGAIHATSSVGKGSIFTVEIPISPLGPTAEGDEDATERLRLHDAGGVAERDVHGSTHLDSR